MNDEAKRLVLSCLEHEAMEETAAYLSRGRAHSGLDLAELHGRWIGVFRTWARSLSSSQNMDDLTAELRLRGLEPPYDQVLAEIEALQSLLSRTGADETRRLAAKIDNYLQVRSDRTRGA